MFIEQELEESTPSDKARKNAWMISFADLLSILLTFFILIYATTISNYTNSDKWKKFTRSAQKTFTLLKPVYKPQGKDLTYLYQIIINLLKVNNEFSYIYLQKQSDHILISIPSKKIFNEDTAVLKPQAQKTFLLLEEFLLDINNSIIIRGVNVLPPFPTVHNLRYNLETPLARAVSFATELKKEGYPYKIQTIGASGSQYDLHLENNADYKDRLDILIYDYKAE